VLQAEGIGALLGCSTSALELVQSSNLSQANLVPSVQDLKCANAVLETKDVPEGMAGGNENASREENLLPARPGKQDWAL